MEEIENRIKKILTEEIELPTKYKNMIRNTLKYENKELRKNTMKKKLVAGLCTGLALMSGVAFATNFEKVVASFGLGNGIDTAVENGYISETNMEYVENLNVKAKIEDFLMDDLNISTHFKLQFDNQTNEKIDLYNLDSIYLKDLFITDEENRIIYSEKEFDGGLNVFIENYNKQTGEVILTYNIYSSGKAFPKSKKLNFEFNKIELKTDNEKSLILEGKWDITVDVSEKMYSRTKEYYKIINCDNKDFEIYTANISETGFELGIIINNIKQPEDFPREKMEKIQILSNEPENTNISEEEAKKLRDEWYTWLDSYEPISTSSSNYKGEQVKASYIENENGEKFYCSTSLSRRAITKYINGNRYNFYETFELTKYNLSNKLKVILYYNGTPVTIELEKSN